MVSLSKTSSYCSLTMSKSSNVLSFNASSNENIWIIDSGATNHMIPHSSYFSSYIALFGNQHITVTNGSNIPIIGCGNIHPQLFRTLPRGRRLELLKSKVGYTTYNMKKIKRVPYYRML